MTVHRHSNDYFDAAPPEVANAVRSVLAQRPPYLNPNELEKDAVFKTNVRPSWWLAGTDMIIRLTPLSGGTQVFARTESQKYIFGDIFNFYNRYIQDLLVDIRTELQKQKA